MLFDYRWVSYVVDKHTSFDKINKIYKKVKIRFLWNPRNKIRKMWRIRFCDMISSRLLLFNEELKSFDLIMNRRVRALKRRSCLIFFFF